MNRVSSLTTTTQLIRDTFRQALASGICWMMLTVTAVCVLLCLSVSVWGDVQLHGGDETIYFLPQSALTAPGAGSLLQKGGVSVAADPEVARRDGIETVSGHMSLAFGAISFPVSRERRDAIGFLELVLAGGVAGTLGVLLMLVWTSGFVPTFLEPNVAAVLLAKPVGRRNLLIGKFVGVLVFVGFQITLFVVLTWLALGARSHVWTMTYLWCIPLLCLEFATFYGFSVLLGVLTRSTVACVFGSALFWILSWGINYGRAMGHDVLDRRYAPAGTLFLVDSAYWISPKPIDAGLILFNTLDAHHHFEKPDVFKALESSPTFSPCSSITSSLVLTVALLALSCRELDAMDY